MKNFISMFLMTSLLLGGMTFTIGKMSVCAASKNRIETCLLYTSDAADD